mmetsp:Transcript_34032/g.51332  ORF Transcript_34032/g.51332 Transcript_34032/m.51332 type:complete len:540 (+) Transcript_34032:62-1681(+)
MCWKDDSTPTQMSLSELLPSKKEFYRLARELNDFGLEHHIAGVYDKALLGYQEAVRIRMIALKFESYKLADIADLSDASVKERCKTVRVQREELALNTADQQTQIPPLDLYHRSKSRSTCDHCSVKIEKPIRSATWMDEEESKYIDPAITLYNIGLVYQKSDRPTKATQLFSMALRVLPQASHPPLGALILYSSAQALYQAGDLKHAAHDLSQLIYTYSATVASGTSYPGDIVGLNLASAIALLGRIHFESKDFDRAAELCQEVLHLRCSVLGRRHIDTAAASYNLALVWAETGRIECIQESISLAKISLHIFISHKQASQSSAVQTSNIIQVLLTLGGLYFRDESFANATHCLNKALQLARKVASEHPSDPAKLVDVADLLFMLAQISHRQGHSFAALELYHESLQVERVFGEEHKEMALVLFSLGQIYHEVGDLGRAFEYQEHVLQLSRRHLGEQGEFLASVLTIIGNIQNERGNTEDAMARFAESERIMVQVRQPQSVENSPISLISLLGIAHNSQAIADLFQNHEIEFHPAAAAA